MKSSCMVWAMSLLAFQVACGAGEDRTISRTEQALSVIKAAMSPNTVDTSDYGHYISFLAKTNPYIEHELVSALIASGNNGDEAKAIQYLGYIGSDSAVKVVADWANKQKELADAQIGIISLGATRNVVAIGFLNNLKEKWKNHVDVLERIEIALLDCGECSVAPRVFAICEESKNEINPMIALEALNRVFGKGHAMYGDNQEILKNLKKQYEKYKRVEGGAEH